MSHSQRDHGIDILVGGDQHSNPGMIVAGQGGGGESSVEVASPALP